AGERPRGALPGRVGIPAPEPLGGGERRHGGRGPYPRARHRGQDRHRADHREVEGHARPGPRLVRRVRAGEESRGRRGRAGGARRQGRGGRRADRAEDPERDLLREGRGDRGPRLMLRVDRRLLQNVDWALFATACALVVVSVMTLATLSVGRAGAAVALRQAAWFVVGLLALVVVACLDYRRLVRAAPALYLLGLAALPLAWLVLRDYQRERILVFLDPFRDPLGSAYNVIQAKIAIGSGQLLGKGVVGATQSRLAFLPERHTDFVFAVFAETWGFVGCLALLMCYLLLLLRGFDIAGSSREPVGRLVALGVTSLLAVQVVINLGMVTGLLPIVGIPLPLMSYGGSSMLASLVAIGLLLSVRMRQFQ